jgi:hypothetical protein
VLGDPRSGVHRARHIIIEPEPRRRFTGQAGRADHGHSRRHVRAQVSTEHRFIEWLARLVGTRVRMRVDQAGEQPAVGGQFGSADRVISPPVTVGEQVDNIAAGQRGPADPQDSH